MGTFNKLVEEYRATHGVKHAEAVLAVRARVGGSARGAAEQPRAGQVISTWVPASPQLPPRPRIFNPALHTVSSDVPGPLLPPLPAPPPSQPPGILGEFRHDGHRIKQRVLIDGRCEISYDLGPDGRYLGPFLTVTGAADIAGAADIPENLLATARRYAEQHREQLLEMLRAARHGAFKADHGGVSAVLQTTRGDVSAWFTRFDDERPVIRRSGVAYEVARAVAVQAFLAVPKDVRRRLFQIARPGVEP